MTSSRFQHCLRVRYHETDQQGIVYHARYLEYIDVAMTEYFRHLGWDYKPLLAEGCDPTIVRTTLEFKRPANFEDQIQVAVRPIAVSNRSFTLRFDIARAADGEHLLSAETVYVNFDPVTQRARQLPPAVHARLSQDIYLNPSESEQQT